MSQYYWVTILGSKTKKAYVEKLFDGPQFGPTRIAAVRKAFKKAVGAKGLNDLTHRETLSQLTARDKDGNHKVLLYHCSVVTVRIPSPLELKDLHEYNFPDSHFFSKETLKFFGDTMSNYATRPLSKKVIVLERKKPVKNGNQSDAYFDMETGKHLTATVLQQIYGVGADV